MLNDYNNDPIFEIFEYLKINNGADAASISEALKISPGSVQIRLDWLERSSYICLQQKDNSELYIPLRETAAGLEDVVHYIREGRVKRDDSKKPEIELLTPTLTQIMRSRRNTIVAKSPPLKFLMPTPQKEPTLAERKKSEIEKRNYLLLKLAEENPGNTSEYIAGRIGMDRNVARKVLLQFVDE